MITESKVIKVIGNYIQNGKKAFIVFPYGNRGKMVEQILNETYGLNCIIADNNIKGERILTEDQLDNYSGEYVLLLSSDNPAIYNDIRDRLKGNFKGEICDLAEIEMIEECYEPFCFSGRKMQIENVDSEQMKKIFEKTKGAWQRLGKEEPYFSVITHDELKTEHITEQAISDFYASGKLNALEIIDSLKRNEIENIGELDILELGCGCGRITGSLSKYFKHVTAVDISEGNLKIAKETIVSENVEFLLMREVEDYLKLPSTDVVYSLMVLQHNCPSVVEYILNIMMGKLKSGGVFMFQIPTYHSGYSFDYDMYMKQPEGMEMHCFTQKRIFELAYENRCIPLEVYPYLCTGRSDNSMMFIFKKMSWQSERKTDESKY